MKLFILFTILISTTIIASEPYNLACNSFEKFPNTDESAFQLKYGDQGNYLREIGGLVTTIRHHRFEMKPSDHGGGVLRVIKIKNCTKCIDRIIFKMGVNPSGDFLQNAIVGDRSYRVKCTQSL